MITEHKVINVLKDGTVVDDLTGRIVTEPKVYKIINTMNEKRKENEH